MKLGDLVEISFSVKNVKEAQQYYEKLGFRKTETTEKSYPTAAFTDGAIVLVLHETQFQSPALTYYRSPIYETRDIFEKISVEMAILEKEGDRITSLAFTDINGLRIILNEGEPARREPYLEKHFSRCGRFGELAVPVEDRGAAVAFWREFGYTSLFESDKPYSWGIYTDCDYNDFSELPNGRMVFGFHQTTDFDEPSITFFSRNSGEQIAALKKEGFDFAVDMGGGNAILKTPDGHLLNIFKGEII